MESCGYVISPKTMKARQNRPIARPFGDKRPTVLVVGEADAKALALHFDETATVVFASRDEAAVDSARADGVEAHRVDVTIATELSPVAEDAAAAIVSLKQDRTTLLTGKLLDSCCGVETVVASVSNPDYHDVFESAGIDVIDTQSLLAGAIREKLPPLKS
jgi:Trk K+ transport system NAD-binding subunit